MDHTYMIEDEVRARKRVAIGLAPQRPTAKAMPQRPPAEPGFAFWRWWPVFLLIAVAGATGLLITAKVLNSPTQWPAVRQNLTTWFAGQKPNDALNNRSASLQFTDDFNKNSHALAAQQEPEQWWINVLPDAGVYRIDVWPGHVTWSTLGIQLPATFRLESAFAVAAETPDGYGGLLGRYQNPDNFYFFVIDGHGRFQAQLRKAGVLYTLQPWISLTQFNPAGQNNVMALEDNQTTLCLYVNDGLVFELLDLQLPPGQAGVVGGTINPPIAQINIDWLKLYSLP